MEHVIDWTKVIAQNRAALALVIEEIFAFLEVALLSGATRLPRKTAAPILRLLRPAESALRRLIIMAARDLNVALPPKRPLPQGLVFANTGAARRMAFKLHDTRKHFRQPDAEAEARKGPRIHVFSPSPLIPSLQPKRPSDATMNLVRLEQRLAALNYALKHLQREAKRLARWRLRRAAKADAKFKSPLRPGPPPGHQRRPVLKIDFILSACHGLAFDALAANTS